MRSQGPDAADTVLTATPTRLVGGLLRATAVLSPAPGHPSSTVHLGAVKLLVTRADVVVGYDDHPIAGAYVDVTVTPQRSWSSALSVAPLDCPDTPPTDGSDAHRSPLPPGRYQVVAVVSNSTSRIVSAAFDVDI